MGQRQVCTFRHALRAAYRTAISAAQILVILAAQLDSLNAFVMLGRELHNNWGYSDWKTAMHSDVTGVSGHRRGDAADQVSVISATLWLLLATRMALLPPPVEQPSSEIQWSGTDPGTELLPVVNYIRFVQKYVQSNVLRPWQ